jgi:hypothetical protein
MKKAGNRPRGRPKKEPPTLTMPSNLRAAKDWEEYHEERYKLVTAACEAIDASCTINGEKLRRSAFDPDAYAFICGAYRSLLLWRMADAAWLSLPEKNLRRRRFIIFLVGAYEAAARRPACRASKIIDERSASDENLYRIDGPFFRYAKTVIAVFGFSDFIPQTDKALSRLIDEALKRRTAPWREKTPPAA